jgi:excisionase family DNA binding protein
MRPCKPVPIHPISAARTDEECQDAAATVAGPLLVDARELARLLDVSVATIWRLKAAGQLPRPVKLGSSTRWRRDEVENWIRAGCPALKTWEARQALRSAAR